MSQRIQDLPAEDRPRERLLRLGPEALSDAELVGLFINTGMKGENAIQIAQRILRECGSLREFSRRSTAELAALKGLGPAKAAILAAAFELGRRSAREIARETPLDLPAKVFDYLGLQMLALNHEEVHLLCLNARLQLEHHELIFRGSLTETSAHPREILRPVMIRTSHAFMIVHNHPSGDPNPSEADRRFTRSLRDAADLLRLKFTDHIIIGHPSESRSLPYFSFRESGLL
jgi:DNA repair protein RadC